MAARLGRRTARPDYWPGFVDALSTLLLVIIFLLSVFLLAQFYLSREVTSRDTVLNRLNRQVSELTELLALERTGKKGLEDQIATLSTSLADIERERERLKGQIAGGAADAQTARGELGALNSQLADERRVSQRALAQVELLNQQIAALRRQVAALEDALQASESRDRESQTKIADLGKRLNVALAQRVQELARYRSDFFGRLREILSQRSDIRVVGDRFVFQSELLFESGLATISPEGQQEMTKLAQAVTELDKTIPAEINWILRVDGHTDVRPIQRGQFRSNWELSAARAVAVARFLVSKGVPPNRVAATAFGEFQPIEPGDSEEANRRNRRIEFKLTER
jgi:chemotaxis protein MotB